MLGRSRSNHQARKRVRTGMDFDDDHTLCALRRRLQKDLHGQAVCEQISDTRPRRNSNAAHLRPFQWARCRTWIIRMSPQPEPSTQEVLAGLVERITYHNAENGFCVLRARARGHRDVVTVIGHAATISAGEWITASGEWVNDRTHGQQFTARFLRTSPPTSADGIETYLSSGMIRGVGPVYAKKLVRAFGEKVFDIIETTPDRLREIDGIGPVRGASILAAWAEQKAVPG